MEEDAAWYGSRPPRRPHCIRRVPSAPRKAHSNTASASFKPMSIVATVAHLSYCWALVQNGGHPQSWIFKDWNSEFVAVCTVQRICTRYFAKFCLRVGQTIPEIGLYRFFDFFFKMTAVCHLEFVVRMFESSSTIGGIYHCTKFGCDAVVTILRKCWYLTSLGGKWLFPPQMGVLGDLTP